MQCSSTFCQKVSFMKAGISPQHGTEMARGIQNQCVESASECRNHLYIPASEQLEDQDHSLQLPTQLSPFPPAAQQSPQLKEPKEAALCLSNRMLAKELIKSCFSMFHMYTLSCLLSGNQTVCSRDTAGRGTSCFSVSSWKLSACRYESKSPVVNETKLKDPHIFKFSFRVRIASLRRDPASPHAPKSPTPEALRA